MSNSFEKMSGITTGSAAMADEIVDIESVTPAPVPLRKMRGSIQTTGGELPFGCYRSRPKVFASKPARPPRATPKKQKSAMDDPQNWAIVVYREPPFPLSIQNAPSAAQGSTGRTFLPRPNAVRDRIPCMRIRGCRVIPGTECQKGGRNAGSPETKRKRIDHHVTVLSDSDSEDVDAMFARVKDEVEHELIRRRESITDGRSEAASVGHYEASTSKSAEKPKMPVRNRSKSKNKVDEPEYSSNDPRARVKEVLENFDNLRRHFLREEENCGKKAEKGTTKRADLRASSILMEKGYRVNGYESILGEVPGVFVGDHFYYRMELLIISLHRQSQGGIDYIPASKSTHVDKSGNPCSVAVSVIASGGYDDDVDEGDTLIYTGQGGSNYKGDKRQGTDQELVRGNLALKNSCDLGLAVRVIRGCDVKKTGSSSSPSGKIYYYDGLYDVKECYQAKGVTSGYNVWKYKLVRKPGQGPLSSEMGMFSETTSLPRALTNRGEKILLQDISLGLEPCKVHVVGSVDDGLPERFQYIVKMKYPSGLNLEPAKACSCTGVCWDKCPCLKWNRGEPPYNENGSLVRGKKAIYECGPTCSCRGECYNKVSQKGLRYDLQIFKSEGKGWGVRSSSFIPQGSFICEYIGEVVHTSEAELRVSTDDYLFDLNVPLSQKKRFGDVSGLVEENSELGDDSEQEDQSCDRWTIDAREYGNVARFINHSCDGNLFVQCVFYEHHDLRFPHIMLFAMEKISPYTELTYDYGAQGGA